MVTSVRVGQAPLDGTRARVSRLATRKTCCTSRGVRAAGSLRRLSRIPNFMPAGNAVPSAFRRQEARADRTAARQCFLHVGWAAWLREHPAWRSGVAMS